MDLEWEKMIENNIFEYISKIDYNHPDFVLNEFKKELRTIIGMEPGVHIKWNTTEKINELKRSSGATDFKEIIDKAEQIDISFINENDKIINLKFIL